MDDSQFGRWFEPLQPRRERGARARIRPRSGSDAPGRKRSAGFIKRRNDPLESLAVLINLDLTQTLRIDGQLQPPRLIEMPIQLRQDRIPAWVIDPPMLL